MFTISCNKCQFELNILSPVSYSDCERCGYRNALEPESYYKPKLLVIQDPTGTEKGKEYCADDEITLGRLQDNNIQLRDSKASRKHARLIYTDNGFIIKDLGSGNGTYVNNMPIQEQPLEDKDLLRIGDTHFMFRNSYSYLPQQATKAVLGDSSALERTNAELKYNSQHSFLTNTKELLSKAEMEKANAKLRILYEVNHAISSTLELQKLLTLILETVFKFIPASRGAILLYDEKDDPPLQIAVTRNIDGVEGGTMTISKTLMEKVIRDRSSILTQDTLLDDSLRNVQSIISQGTRAAMSVPLMSKDALLAILYVDTTEKTSQFNEDTLELLTAIAGQAAVVIENAKLIKKIELEVETRGHLQRYLSPELVEQVVNKKINIDTGGQVKKATVLFTDLRGFTKMTENIGAEAVVGILNDYFTRMVDIIFGTNGTLDKFMGDAIMGIWGIPVSHVEDPYLSVKAAIEMQRELFYFNVSQKRAGKNTLKMGAGINTGNIVVGNMGSPKRMEYTVIGPDVNLASRVEHLTTRNQVLITDNTYNEAPELIQCIELEPTRVKGIDRDIQVYGVVSVKKISPSLDNETVRLSVDSVEYIKFVPVLIQDPQNPEIEYEGLLQNLSPQSVSIDMEFLKEPHNLLEGTTITFFIDMPKIIPDDPVTITVRSLTSQMHNDDEYLDLNADIVDLPVSVKDFFDNMFRD